jgi:glutamate transport system substrate-binding protein
VYVGVGTDLPGLATLNPDTHARAGFDIDLVRWLGNNPPAKFTPVEVDVTVADRVEAVKQGRVDLAVESFSMTDERRKSIGFAGPYLITQQGVLVRAGDTRIKVVNDLAGKSVCTQTGGTSLDQLNNGGLGVKVTLVAQTGTRECVEMVLKGLVDAASTDQLILQGFARNDPRRLAVVPDLAFGAQERYGVGLPHGNVEKCREISEGIKAFITTGAWDQFFRTNFGDLNPSGYQPDPYKLDPCR